MFELYKYYLGFIGYNEIKYFYILLFLGFLQGIKQYVMRNTYENTKNVQRV